jgi:hypothetical protein
MMDSFILVIGSFFALFAVFVLVGIYAARQRLKRSERLMEDMMREYENAYQQNPDDGFLRDNVIELRNRRWEEREKNNKK